MKCTDLTYDVIIAGGGPAGSSAAIHLAQKGLRILLVEQNALMALEVAHRGYVLQTGRIVLHDAAPALLRSDLVRKSYLGEK